MHEGLEKYREAMNRLNHDEVSMSLFEGGKRWIVRRGGFQVCLHCLTVKEVR